MAVQRESSLSPNGASISIDVSIEVRKDTVKLVADKLDEFGFSHISELIAEDIAIEIITNELRFICENTLRHSSMNLLVAVGTNKIFTQNDKIIAGRVEYFLRKNITSNFKLLNQSPVDTVTPILEIKGFTTLHEVMDYIRKNR